MRSTDMMWDFPVMDGVTFPNANRIHPLMQHRVEKILLGIRRDQNVHKLILYGSSLEFHCNSASDIDLYIEKYDPDQKLAFFPDLDCETDIITNLPGALAGLRPAVVAMIASAGITLVIMSFYGERVLPADLSGINVISVIIFAIGFFVLRKWKVNPIYVMMGAGAAGVLLYSVV